MEKISIIIHKPEALGREAAAKFLGISLNRFHELRDEGIIPCPKKRQGFKEKEYYTRDLEKCMDLVKIHKK